MSKKQLAVEQELNNNHIYKAFINRGITGGLTPSSTTPHEILHLLGYGGLAEDDHTQLRYNLLSINNLNAWTEVNSNRRINQKQESKIHSETNVINIE